MEDRSSVGISIKNVPVRLNEGNLECEAISDCKKNLYDSASSGNNAQGSQFTKICETSQPIQSLDASSGIKLSHDHSNYGDSGLLNGCSDFLHNDLNSLHISVNGVDKFDDHELLDPRLGEVNHVTWDRPPENATAAWTEHSLLDLDKTLKSPTESSVSIHDVFSSVADYPTNDEKTVAGSLPLGLTTSEESDNISYLGYDSENQMPDIIRLIQKDLSEPYSIYTYRYFIHNWPKLCFLALHRNQCVGAIVCKLDVHKKHSRRGYIAMLAVDEKYRKRKIGSNLVLKAIDAMVEDNADEVVLETEITNKPALKLYENLGFVRDKRLFRYYLNGVDALRLKLWLR